MPIDEKNRINSAGFDAPMLVEGRTRLHLDSSPAPLSGLNRSIEEIHTCRQLIIVTTSSWNNVNATVQLMDRRQAGSSRWRKVGTPVQAVIGKRGFAWGQGLHGSGEPGSPEKKEGDQKSPAGVFQVILCLRDREARTRFAFSGFHTNRSMPRPKRSMTLAPGITIGSSTEEQSNTPTGQLRSRCFRCRASIDLA